MKKDKNNKNLCIGDTVITTVSKKSHYLTIATVIEEEKDTELVLIYYASTPKVKWVPASTCIKVEKKIIPLSENSNTCKDCMGQELSVGDEVIYRTSGNGGMEIGGKITSIESDLWLTINDNLVKRNISVYKL